VEYVPVAEVERLRQDNLRLRAFAFGDAPEWEQANCTLKHRIRELEAEVERLKEALEEIASRPFVGHTTPVQKAKAALDA
jgi:hypothetical protein